MSSITFIFAIALTLVAATLESFAFMYSFDAMKQGTSMRLLVTSFGLYSTGIVLDYFALYVMSKSSFYMPELLSMIFMVSVIIGIAVLSGNFFSWRIVDQCVAVLVVLGIAWLSFRVE